MSKDLKGKKSSIATMRAAKRFSRRTLLKNAAVLGSAAAAAPIFVKKPFAASGELDVIIWSNYLTEDFIEKFTDETGITVNYTPLGSNEELLNKLKASKGRGFDIISPTLNRKGQWEPLQLTQPWDLTKITNLTNVDDAFVKASAAWTWGGGQHHVPHIWGTEAMSWRTDMYTTEYGKLSLGDLWIPEMKGKIQGRPHSMMAGIGRYLAEKGDLPPFNEAYENEEKMRKIWEGITAFAVEHKPWVKSFWNDHVTQKTNFMQNGVVIGQTWDGPAIELMKEGAPVQYMAPKEGAFAWLDGLCMPTGAKNIDEAYELLNHIYTKEAAAGAAIATGYNGVVSGAAELLDGPSKAAFQSAYPDDALAKLWWWPDEPQWYAEIRAEYRDKFVAA
ncbi:MAG: extracellular solute-binding protein [Pseudomonadota bacterium]